MKLFFTLFIFYSSIAYGQKTPFDSLEQKISLEKVDTQKLNYLKQLVNMAFATDMQLALLYAKRGVALADKINDQKRQPEFYEMEGRMHANLLNLDSATLFFNKAMKGYVDIGNRKGQATTFFKIGWVFKKKGEAEKALDADLNALKLMENLGDPQGLAGAYERVADDLIIQQRLKEAGNYAQKAIDICKENNLQHEMVYALTGAGSVAINDGKNKEAFDFFDEALRLAINQKLDPVTLSDFYNNRGNAYKRLAKYKEALKDYQTAHDLAIKANYNNAIAATIANLGEVNLLLGNYKEALSYQLETVNLQEQNNDKSNLIENYLHVSNIYEHLGDYHSALNYHKKALALRDSVSSAESDSTMSGMLTRYETKKKEATISVLGKELSQQRKIQWLGAGLLALMVAFIVFGYFTLQIRIKRSRLLAAKNAENELLLKEIHHRVKNNLEVVSSLLSLQSAQIDDPHTRNAIQESQNRVHSIGIVHQKLYQGNTLDAIEMKDYFLNLSESVLDSFGAEKKIKIELAMEKLDIDIDTAVPLGLIVNELLTNTIKYAFPDGKEGHVLIKLEKQKSGNLHLEVADNGMGKSGITKGTGFGTQLISLLTRQLNGIMREDIKNGTRILFDFKIPASA
ncbi:MAG: histidine kinase dimerization/phosphoacceptor domain -containing protein [Ginsengibacter sp.]